MFWHASKDDFFGYYKQNRGKYWTIFNADHKAGFVFFQFCAKRLLSGVYSAITTAKRKTPAQIS
jgi:hypothetical protein